MRSVRVIQELPSCYFLDPRMLVPSSIPGTRNRVSGPFFVANYQRFGKETRLSSRYCTPGLDRLFHTGAIKDPDGHSSWIVRGIFHLKLPSEERCLFLVL